MGAATSVGGWLPFSSEAIDVVLVLNDARNIGLLNREELSGQVHLNSDDSALHCLTRESHCSLSLTTTKIVVVEFQGLIHGQEAQDARCLGEVCLPLHHIARQSGGCLYQVWLPLQPVSAFSKEDDYIDHFDKALMKAARDPRKPMVCLSLYAGSIPEASKNYLFDASEAEKATRFLGLLQSHSQHARMLQALYREVRASQASSQAPSAMENTGRSKDGLADSWSESRRPDGSPMGFAEFSPEAKDDARNERDASPVEDPRAILREEIRETKGEADERISKAEKTIRALEEMISDKQVELIQRRKEVSRLKHESESLELESEKLELQLTRGSLRSPTAADAVEEGKLRREAEELSTQKEALLLILRDFYRAMGQDMPSLKAMVSRHQEASRRPKVVEQEPAPVQEWTNMLPRPSELLLSGLDERFGHET